MVALREEGLLPEEDPGSPYPEDSIHWIIVYRELLMILEHAQAVSKAQAAGDPEGRFMDQDILQTQAARYAERLQFWIRRAREFSDG
ncbi:MAG: hypothetical protein JOY68_08455 [Candidatus Dormibacteraeota bacterium]|nr:hypothetical protein [Candidatus Dormibacteraeota bacterium]MBV8445865.1 hypothetical protein [Candidatus Dormibacteraeota bacterium]